MTDRFLDKVYDQSRDGSRDIYVKWSETYDSKVYSNDYMTPQLYAKASAQFVSDLNATVLDYGDGTWLLVEALRAEGFTTLHGYDIYKEILALADGKSIYSVLKCFDPEEGPEISAGMLHAISAIGVISEGAAPPSTFASILDLLATDGLFVFSFDDSALADPEFESKVKKYGDQMPGTRLKAKFNFMKKA